MKRLIEDNGRGMSSLFKKQSLNQGIPLKKEDGV